MNTQAFASALTNDGFTEIVTRDLPANHATTDHSHPFHVRALVTAGDITLTTAEGVTTYRSGEVFVMAAGHTHRERVGTEGVAYIVGTRTAN